MSISENNIGFKIQLYPTEEQCKLLSEYFGASRYVYNFVLDKEKEAYENDGNFLSKYSMNNLFTKFKKDIPWLNKLDSTALKLRIFDACRSFINFFNNRKMFKHPIYKNKKDVKQMTCIRGDRAKITESSIYCPGIGWVSCGYIPNKNIIGEGLKSQIHPETHRKYYNTRIVFDGLHYWFTMSMEVTNDINYESLSKYNSTEKSKSIGIDIGCKGENWIVDSNKNKISLPDFHRENKKIKHLQRKLDRQYHSRAKNDDIRSKNMEKTIAKLCKYNQRKTNKRKARLYNYISHEILKINPECVVIEDISSLEMIRDNNRIPKKRRAMLNQSIYDSSIGEFQNIISKKCKIHNIPIIKAHRNYPSTKRCSCCGKTYNVGMKRIYRCKYCGLIIDRDYNAALNLAQYPYL